LGSNGTTDAADAGADVLIGGSEGASPHLRRFRLSFDSDIEYGSRLQLVIAGYYWNIVRIDHRILDGMFECTYCLFVSYKKLRLLLVDG
jgi:hypothetical protein